MDAGGGLGDDAALEALRDVLAALSATAPRLVFKKTLNRADVDPNQARLLIPCRKRGVITDADALAAFLTAEEKDIGMQVPAYDRHGRRFDMRLWMVGSNSCYRLFGPQWSRFLADNQLEEAMAVAKEMGRKPEVEFWAFRSAELERHVEAGQHPDGALGMAILIRN
ncbi:hypothetical protein SORBI_3009G124300 [Sorghum bicolor]|uniref:TF-B3 domain-containing protein n=2 Tax=Sorghum bicolor TaxID=4558 RepID=A0A1B6P8A9_SORBI|nr:hypothetical protein SORBI_3009G124300 [Sorghum bicolor]